MVEGVETQAVGSISIRIHSQYLKTFDENYLNLDPFDHHENPWFSEFWEDKFHCKMPANRVEATTPVMIETTTEIPSYENETNPSLLPLKDNQQVPFCTGEQAIIAGQHAQINSHVPHIEMNVHMR